MMKLAQGIALGLALLLIIGTSLSQRTTGLPETASESTIFSPYAGQEARDIKALSDEDIQGLLAGSGTPFGGMAKPAELNGYPGPRHVLDAAEGGELELTSEQQKQVEALYEEMRSGAIELGKRIIDVETAIDEAFADGTITEEWLEEEIEESARLYGQLRMIHLKAHLSMVGILTGQQVERYNELRGYTSGDPCENVPEGHDPELWRLHHDCG
jgi:Spy/CpxP family protein refolding chaperone